MGRDRIDRLVAILIAAAFFLALVGFAKVVLSPLVAAFIAGIGLGSAGVLALRR